MNDIIFFILPKLPPFFRWVIALVLFVLGISLQLVTRSFPVGGLLIFAATLFLLHRGIDKRAFPGKFSHDAIWQKTDRQQIVQILEMNNKLRKWDLSLFEITSWPGVLIFILLIILSLIMMITGAEASDLYRIFLGGNILLLIVPHFFFGLKLNSYALNVVLYAKECLKAEGLLKSVKPDAEAGFMVLTVVDSKTGKPFPKEVKMNIKYPGKPDKMLGFYGQLSINMVKSAPYPYFYVVLVFKENSGLKSRHNRFIPSEKVVCEYSTGKDVEILVIRQMTTKTSGYFTNEKSVTGLFSEAFRFLQTI